MGVTIQTKHAPSIDLGYIGFRGLRTRIAYLVNEELGKLYEDIPMYGTKEDFEKYDKRIQDLSVKLGDEYDCIFEFLYASDCNGKISYKTSKEIWKYIKDYDDNVCYGYSGRPDCAMFKDFKEIIKSSMEKRCIVEWW